MAKPLTRFARSIANKLGYDLLRLQRSHIHHEALSGLGRGQGFDAFEPIIASEVNNFDIYLRSCARVDVLGQDRQRFLGVSKTELILRCLNSLVRSVNWALENGVDCNITLSIIDDHSSLESQSAIIRLINAASFSTKFLKLQGTGVSASLRETYELARSEAKGLIYFAADDYLHDECAVYEIVKTYERLVGAHGCDVVLFPSDYPDQYKQMHPSIITLGSHRHWRSADDSTGADVVSVEILKKYWDIYMKFSEYGTDPEVTEANTISLIYRNSVPLFTPLPSLSVHFQHFDTLSPYFDWRHWWDKSKVIAEEVD